MQMINYFDFFKNMEKVFIEGDCALGYDLSVVSINSPQVIKTFNELVEIINNRWETIFSTSLEPQGRKFLMAKLQTRLENIAIHHFKMKYLEIFQEIEGLRSPIDNFLEGQFSTEEYFWADRKIEQEADNSEYWFVKHANGMYQESQKNTRSCQGNAFNNFIGKHLDFYEYDKSYNENSRLFGFNLNQYFKLAAKKEKNICIIASKDIENFPSVLCVSFDHAFVYKKDNEENWWKIDSNNKVLSQMYIVKVKEIKEEIKNLKCYTMISDRNTWKKSCLQIIDELKKTAKFIKFSGKEDWNEIFKKHILPIEFEEFGTEMTVFQTHLYEFDADIQIKESLEKCQEKFSLWKDVKGDDLNSIDRYITSFIEALDNAADIILKDQI